MSSTFGIITFTVFCTCDIAVILRNIRITSCIVVYTIFFFGSLEFCVNYVVVMQIQINHQNLWQGVIYFINQNCICNIINMISPNSPISTLTRMHSDLVNLP
jgi:hypothetical protein